jgi:hypothetical protein
MIPFLPEENEVIAAASSPEDAVEQYRARFGWTLRDDPSVRARWRRIQQAKAAAEAAS